MGENENEKIPQYVRDADTLPPGQLAAKYRRTWNSWRNRKSRNKKYWSPEFADFCDFLRHMGEAPEGHTLDRIDPHNPHYGPGLCRWAPPKVQANNRTNTDFVDVGGEYVPLTPLAEDLGISPQTLRRRLDQVSSFGRDPRKYRPWPAAYSAEWEALFNEAGGATRLDRYAFLIGRLRAALRKNEDWLYEHQDDLDSPDPAVSEAYREVLSRSNRTRDALTKAEQEYPLWKSALARFNAAQAERRMLQGFQPPADDDDW